MKPQESTILKIQLICRAILFDMDGVLLDSKPSVERQWTKWANRHGLDPKAVLAVAHGVRTVETVRKLTPQLDAEQEAKSIEVGEIDDTEGLRALPGAKDMLDNLPSGAWTIVTSATRLLAEVRLKFVGLPVPSMIVTADDVRQGKPHPEPYLAGAAKLGRRPEECLVVEDAPAGIRAARIAGMKVLALATTHSVRQLAAEQPDAIVSSLADVSVHEEEQEIVIEIRAEAP